MWRKFWYTSQMDRNVGKMREREIESARHIGTILPSYDTRAYDQKLWGLVMVVVAVVGRRHTHTHTHWQCINGTMWINAMQSIAAAKFSLSCPCLSFLTLCCTTSSASSLSSSSASAVAAVCAPTDYNRLRRDADTVAVCMCVCVKANTTYSQWQSAKTNNCTGEEWRR